MLSTHIFIHNNCGMIRIIRPLALLAAASTLSRTPQCNNNTPHIPQTPPARTKLAEVKKDSMVGEDYPILRLIVMVVKRYYLGIMRASMKAWL